MSNQFFNATKSGLKFIFLIINIFLANMARDFHFKNILKYVFHIDSDAVGGELSLSGNGFQ